MTKVIAVLTGSTGFLGKKFLAALRKQNEACFKYSDILLVGREDKCVSVYSRRFFKLTDLPKGEKHFFHFATLYNPRPKSFSEIESIFNSNVLFPIQLMKTIPQISKVYCMQSYQELLPFSFQSEYSLSKRLFARSLESCGLNTLKFYLFDNFGANDKRGKVVDVFIDKALADDDIIIPSNEVFINLCEASNIIENILNLIDSDRDSYLIGNKEKISLSDLANFIIYEVKSKSKVIFNGTAPDLLKYLEGEITNLTEYDNNALYEGLSEHIYKKRTSLL